MPRMALFGIAGNVEAASTGLWRLILVGGLHNIDRVNWEGAVTPGTCFLFFLFCVPDKRGSNFTSSHVTTMMTTDCPGPNDPRLETAKTMSCSHPPLLAVGDHKN